MQLKFLYTVNYATAVEHLFCDHWQPVLIKLVVRNNYFEVTLLVNNWRHFIRLMMKFCCNYNMQL